MKKNFPKKQPDRPRSTRTAPSKSTDFVYGPHSCLELLTAKRRKAMTVYTTTHEIKSWNKIKKLLPAHVPIKLVTRQTLDAITNNAQHQGIVIATSSFVYEKQMFDPKNNQFIVVLDGIQDVGNLGAIVRSAYCAGVDGIVLCGKNSASLTPAAIKASAGLAEHCKIFIAPSMQFVMQELKSKKYHSYVTTLEGGQNAAQVTFEKPAALIIGNEESGVGKEALKAQTRILLPQRRADISYNASVAAGILMFLMGVKFEKIS
jgi:23S rRNA (guanosine2251-2'-O)-methyltransferase